MDGWCGLIFRNVFVSFAPEFASTVCTELILSPTVSLYFVAQGEVCTGASFAALQQRVPGSSLSHSPLRDATLLFLKGKPEPCYSCSLSQPELTGSNFSDAGHNLSSQTLPLQNVFFPHISVVFIFFLF